MKNKRSAFTLIELLVASAGTLGLLGMILAVYVGIFKGLEVLTIKTAATSSLQSTLVQLGRDARAARAAPMTVCGSFTPSASVLLLENAGGTTRTIYQCAVAGACTAGTPGVLERHVRSSDCLTPMEPMRVMTRNVIALNFTRAARRLDVLLGVRASVRVGGFSHEAQLTDLFILRGR